MASSQAGAARDDRVTFEQLVEVDRKFADSEIVLLHKANELQAPLYDERADITARVSGFWPVVLEQAPPEIDQYISPSDFTALASLTSLDVTRFEITHDGTSETASNGEPRSVSFTFTFAENEFFTDKVLTKKFWYRRADDGWTGLVSEPVKIHWKPGKDLTGGLLDLAVSVWEAEQAGAQLADVQDYEQLVSKLEQTSDGSVSFFAWFGYRGRRVRREESARATKKEQMRREKAKREHIVVVGHEEENGSNGEEQSASDAGTKDEDIGESDEASHDEDMGHGVEVSNYAEDMREGVGVSDDEEHMGEGVEVSIDEEHMVEGVEVSIDEEHMREGVGVGNDEEDMGEGVEVGNDEENMGEAAEVSSDEEHMGEGVEVSLDEEDMDEGVEDSNDEEDVGNGGTPLPPEMAIEIFPRGEDLAISLSEDLFPGAIKYFIGAHEHVSVAGSEPSELPEDTDTTLMDPPDLEDSALICMVENDEERAKKRKRI